MAQPSTRAVKFHPDSSYMAESLLRNAASHAAENQWTEAVEIYERVLREHRGSMAQVPQNRDDPLAGESTLFVDVGLYCQSRLSEMPEAARTAYRRRIDPDAERWYREGIQRLDPDLLRRVVDQAFCSSWADESLDALGDLAFREGRFREALACYRALVPDTRQAGLVLAYPDPQVEPARVAAKILLCRAAMGENPPSREDFEAFAARHPGAAGTLAGRNGLYVDSVAAALKADQLLPAATVEGRWPTFAGSPSRTVVAPGALDVGSFQWKVKLDPIESTSDFNPAFVMGRRPNGGLQPRAERQLAYHPIVVGDQVIVAEANRIVAYNLTQRPGEPGTPEGEVPIAWDQRLSSAFPGRGARQIPGSPRFTLTAHGDRIYARLGPTGVRPGPSFIIAVRNNPDVEGKLLWRQSSADIAPPERKGAQAGRTSLTFEGTPVADDRNVYVALTESSNTTSSYVACLEAETGSVRWVRFVGEATLNLDPTFALGASSEVGGRLLTLDGPTIYYQTNMGALAAIEAETGVLRWLATYPYDDQRQSPTTARRELSPAVAADGRVFIAPTDAGEILAYDAATGRLAWKSQTLPEAVHLLGVVQNRLVATGNRVWLLDEATGKIAARWPQSGTGMEGHGRGLLAGGLVYWPTRSEIRVVDPATGLEDGSSPIALQQAFGTGAGNLALGDGYLVVAQADALVVFCQNRRLIDRYRDQIAAAPEQAANYVRLARVAEATDQDELALESLDSALERARPSETLEGELLREVIQRQRFRLLMRLAEGAAGEADWDLASQRCEMAATASSLGRDQLQALLRRAELMASGNQLEASVELYQSLLADERYRNLPVEADVRRQVRADRLIADRLARLVKQAGPEVYRSFENRARSLLDEGRSSRNPHLLEEVARSYPVASVVPEALLALGKLHLEAGQPREAARALRRLLATDAPPAYGARAMLGLARAHEEQRLWALARETYAQAQARFGTVQLEGEMTTVGSIAAERLTREPLSRLSGGQSPADLPVPLSRRWSVRWPLAPSAHPIPAAGMPPGPDIARIFVTQGHELRPIEPESGDSPWTADLGADPRWVGFVADHLLAATDTRVFSLDLATGATLWSLEAGNPVDLEPPRDPFARARPPEPPGERQAQPGPIHDFRIVGDRLYCLRGEVELLTIDAGAGLIDWSYHPDEPQRIGRWSVDPQRIVLQRLGPQAIVVLDTGTGTLRSEFLQDQNDPAWLRDPWPVDEDHVAIVTDDRTVALLDLERGILVWTYREPAALPRGGAPLLLGDVGRLLVLRDGGELVRLDVASGQKLWSRVLGIEDLGESTQSLTIAGDRVFCITGPQPTLAAYRVTDGSPIWRKHLSGPPARWSLVLSERFVFAYPRPRDDADDAPAMLPLLLCGRDDGRLVQRLLIPAEVTDLAVSLTPGLAMLATRSGGWALGTHPLVDVPGSSR